MPRLSLCIALIGALIGSVAAAASSSPDANAVGTPQSACHVPGIPADVRCGRLSARLDPSDASSAAFDLHYVVMPARALRPREDAVFVLAGGPGQSAVDRAAALAPLLSRLNNRRDLVFVGLRGTGDSAPLVCPRRNEAPLGELLDPDAQARALADCRVRLARLPWGDLRQFGTPAAAADVEALRVALGYPQVNLLAFSYGTRVALEYRRRFAGTVRRLVLDGVLPPDAVMPESFGTDAQAAFDALLAACRSDLACDAVYPDLALLWRELLDGLPRETTLPHPLRGTREAVRVTRGMLLGMVRGALYSPVLSAALPHAIREAAAGRFEPLFGVASMTWAARARRGEFAWGLHYAVVCGEDLPRALAHPGAREFEAHFDALYRTHCDGWPRQVLPPEFERVTPTTTAALLLSGGRDPATPPRHAARAAEALGPLARHVVAAQAGHGVLQLGCARDVLFRFIDVADEAAARDVDAGCLARVPAPPFYVPRSATPP